MPDLALPPEVSEAVAPWGRITSAVWRLIMAGDPRVPGLLDRIESLIEEATRDHGGGAV